MNDFPNHCLPMIALTIVLSLLTLLVASDDANE